MIVFISNYYNHHQAFLSEQLFTLTNGEYRFIATQSMTKDRISLGWGGQTAPFVMSYADAPDECQALIDQADATLFGSASYGLIQTRLKRGRLTFIYSERIYKTECPAWQMPLRAIKMYGRYGRYKNAYLLCASAYAAVDYAKTGTFKGKAYRWGYFPEVKKYDSIDRVWDAKQPKTILWVARLIAWKHPELPIRVASRLRADGYDFTLNMIGNGDMEDVLRHMIQQHHLDDCVHLLGSMKPEQVREHMEHASIFMFTSDRYEGWGAVLNESMNSGCAVVANRAIGSVPYLLQDGHNGLSYQTEDELYDAVKRLLDDNTLCRQLGEQAYRTMVDTWNPEIAADRFVKLMNEISTNGVCTLFEDGPCSAESV